VRLVFLIAKTVHGGLYRLSGGRIGAHLAGLPVLLLTTTGRKSGKPRTVPLSYLEWGDAMVVIGSKGGAQRHPDWYLNLEADPAVEVQVGRTRERRRARRATPEEAGRLWPEVLARAPGYGRYRAKTSREIPLVLLEGASGPAAPETR
jgi:deazaflavin-dependent oxidoreductase (nitroreductase family)